MILKNYFKNINLTLDKPVYYAGDVINGSIQFDNSHRSFINNVRIKLIGYAKINWNQSRSLKTIYANLEKNFTAKESYVEKEIFLISKEQNRELIIDTGSHSYQFRFNLPSSCPSSFEHPCGRICYKISFEVSESPGKSELIYEQTISVLHIIDLNLRRDLKHSNSIKINKIIKRCCCSVRGTVGVKFSLTQGAFVTGQNVLFNLIINNESSKNIKNLYVYLIQETRILTNASFRIVSKFKFPKIIKKRTTEILKDGAIQIPAVCHTFETRLIKCNYFLMLNIDRSEKKRFKEIKSSLVLPILIGNKPFREDDYYQRLVEFRTCIFGKNYDRKDPKGIANNLKYADYRPLYLCYNKIDSIV